MQRFVFVRLRCGRDLDGDRGWDRAIGAEGSVTLLAGKARSLAARRRAKRGETDAESAALEATEATAANGDAGGSGIGAALEAMGEASPGAGPRGSRLGAAGVGSGLGGAGHGAGVAGTWAAGTGLGGAGVAGSWTAGTGLAGAGGVGGPARRVALTVPDGLLTGRLHGRDDVVRRLGALVWAPDGRARVLAGAGGTGKTAIALRVAREATRRGVPVWWVQAADARTVTVSLLDLAADLGAQPAEVAQAGAGQRDAADLLWRYLEQRAPWLLVFDGADDPVTLTGPGWLRRAQGGLILVTSRHGDGQPWGRHAELHPIGRLDPVAGGKALTDLAPDGGSALQAAALAERLGGLPLALRLAGSLLAASGQAFSDYGPVDSRDAVASGRELALEALAAGGRPQARALLRVLCCLAPAAGIPAAMLDMDVLGRVCDGDAALAKKGLRALSRVGLIASHDAGVTVHRMVCEISRVYTGDAAARAGGVAVAMLAAAAAGLDPKADWPAWVALQPHVSAVYGYLGEALSQDSLAALTGVAAAAATAFLHAGHHAAAAELATEALRHARRLRSGANAEHDATLGLCDAVALGTGYQLARLLARQGQYEGAQRCLRELLDAQARTLGPEHPSTLAARHEFGLVLAQRGQYAQAAREFAELLAARVAVLGSEHRDTRVTRRWLKHLAAAEATLRS